MNKIGATFEVIRASGCLLLYNRNVPAFLRTNFSQMEHS